MKEPPIVHDPAAAFFTVNELAARWKVHPRHIYRLIDSGKLPSYKIGRVIRIARRDVTVFEAENLRSI